MISTPKKLDVVDFIVICINKILIPGILELHINKSSAFVNMDQLIID